jgi:hypothetical protein
MMEEIICKRARVAAAAVTLIMATGAANADVIHFVGYGTPVAGQTLITNFATDAGLTGTYLFGNGTTGNYAAPATTYNSRDPNQYLAVERDDSVTLSLGSYYHDISIYIGSLDSYNGLAFSNNQAFTGGQLAKATGAYDNGNQQSSHSNGLLTFEFATAVDSVTFLSSSIAFEVASVSAGGASASLESTSAVPEPATWAMMLIGFAGLGFAGYRQKKRKGALALSAA